MAISATAISSSVPTACARCSTGNSRISAIRWRISAGSASTPGASARSTSRSAASARARNCSRATRPRAASVDPARVKFWEVMGTLRWGVMCCGMMQRFRVGPDHSMERAMIGRRASETEIDLLRLACSDGESVSMQDEPTPTELTKAVADFLRNDIAPLISGHNAFKLRVAINALDLVTRQLTLEQGGRCRGKRAAGGAAGHAGLAARSQSRARRAHRERRARSADAGARRASVADHDGQARGRSAELCVVQEGVGRKMR